MLEVVVTLLQQQNACLLTVSAKLSGSAHAAHQVGALKYWGF